MPISHRLGEISKHVGGQVDGDPDKCITGVAAVERASVDQLTFINSLAKLNRLAGSHAGAAIVPADSPTLDRPIIRASNVEVAFAEAMTLFAPAPEYPPPGTHPSAQVDPTAQLGEDLSIGPNVVICEGASVGDRAVLCAGVYLGRDAKLGCDCVLYPGVVVRYGCTLADRVHVHANTVIGSDGFGYRLQDGVHRKVPQLGTVRIEEDVEIGACCCIDRAKFDATVVGAGSKIDNLVMIAHNVTIGRGTILAAQVGIAGSCKLGDYVVFGGQSGMKDHIDLGERSMVGANSGVIQSFPPGSKLCGHPARDVSQWLRLSATQGRLPDLVKTVRELKKRVAELEASTDDRK